MLPSDDHEKVAVASAFAVLAIILLLEVIAIVRLRNMPDQPRNVPLSIWTEIFRRTGEAACLRPVAVVTKRPEKVHWE